MKFLRILPETCASTWCLFSSSTLNIALGSGSITTAITSIASSLLIQLQLSVLCYQLSVVNYARPALRFTTDHWQPTTDNYSVKITGPFFVTATVCSKCALCVPSFVTAVQLSASTRVSERPTFTMGSIASTMPSRNFGPLPGVP